MCTLVVSTTYCSNDDIMMEHGGWRCRRSVLAGRRTLLLFVFGSSSRHINNRRENNILGHKQKGGNHEENIRPTTMVKYDDYDDDIEAKKPRKLDETFDVASISVTASTDIMSEDSQSFLVDENERLKAQVEKLRRELAAVRGGNHRGGRTSTTRATRPRGREREESHVIAQRRRRSASEGRYAKSDHGKLDVELPKTYLHGEEHSSGTDDDDDLDAVEPNIHIDLEAHESSKGLHYRTLPRGSSRKALINSSKRKSTSMHEYRPVTVEDADEEVALFDDDDDEVEVSSPPGSISQPSLLEESFFGSVKERAGWLVGLLVLQSCSSFILARNEALLEDHMVIIRFLTMLVGAGGNAGNQASVRVIRGLATGEITDSNTRSFFNREMKMGLALSGLLGLAGCIRAAIFRTPLMETIAITSSLLMIVTISIFLGVLLPLVMRLVRIDPAHSSTTIQVFMDILGVAITVHVSRFVLDSDWSWLVSSISISDA